MSLKSRLLRKLTPEPRLLPEIPTTSPDDYIRMLHRHADEFLSTLPADDPVRRLIADQVEAGECAQVSNAIAGGLPVTVGLLRSAEARRLLGH